MNTNLVNVWKHIYSFKMFVNIFRVLTWYELVIQALFPWVLLALTSKYKQNIDWSWLPDKISLAQAFIYITTYNGDRRQNILRLLTERDIQYVGLWNTNVFTFLTNYNEPFNS